MKRRTPPALFTPDLVIENDAVEFLYSLWGFCNGDKVVSIGPNRSPELIAERLAMAKAERGGRNNHDSKRLAP